MNENNFIGEVIDLFQTIPYSEGIKGKSYAITIRKEDEDLYRFFLPIGQQEVDSEKTVAGSILDLFLDEVKITFPETEQMVTYQDIMEAMKFKKVRWVWKPLGPYVYDIPPIKYPVPRKILKEE